MRNKAIKFWTYVYSFKYTCIIHKHPYLTNDPMLRNYDVPNYFHSDNDNADTLFEIMESHLLQFGVLPSEIGEFWDAIMSVWSEQERALNLLMPCIYENGIYVEESPGAIEQTRQLVVSYLHSVFTPDAKEWGLC